MSESTTMLVSCGTVDWGCADDEWLEALDPELQAKAEVLAWETLRSLTAYRLGNCPVTVRPCSKGCWARSSYERAPVVGGLSQDWGSGMIAPRVVDGQWLNTCGCTSVPECSCTTLPVVILPGPVGAVTEVTVDGVVLDPTAYRVDNGNELVRTDGGTWPACQDMVGPTSTGYAPVVLTLPSAEVTFERDQQVVTATVHRTGVGSFPPGTLAPWGSVTPTSANPTGSFATVFPDRTLLGEVTTGGDDYVLIYETPDTTPPETDGTGTFTVTYVQGFAPDQMAAWAAGLLAVEFAKACRGEKCALPRGVQTLSRQGIGLTINQDMFAGGSTGITVVDAYVRLLNPHHVVQPARVYSPDRGEPRRTTWARG